MLQGGKDRERTKSSKNERKKSQRDGRKQCMKGDIVGENKGRNLKDVEKKVIINGGKEVKRSDR